MARILAPNKQYTGISAGVSFSQGVGECTNHYLLDWFKSKGYEVEEETKDTGDGNSSNEKDGDRSTSVETENTGSELESMTVEELKGYAEIHGIDLGKATSKEGILKKIMDANESD